MMTRERLVALEGALTIRNSTEAECQELIAEVGRMRAALAQIEARTKSKEKRFSKETMLTVFLIAHKALGADDEEG